MSATVGAQYSSKPMQGIEWMRQARSAPVSWLTCDSWQAQNTNTLLRKGP